MWGELANYSSHQINCSPSKTINFKSPIELYNSVIPTHTHPFKFDRLKPFSCLAYAHDRHRSSKVGPIAKRFIFVGIEPNARAWRLWDKHTKRIFITGDAEFRESVFPARDRTHSPTISSLDFKHNNLHDLLTTTSDINTDPHSQTHANPDLDLDTHEPISRDTADPDLNTDTHAPHSQDTPDPVSETYTPDMINCISPTSTRPEQHPEESTAEEPTINPRRTNRKTAPPQRYGFSTTVTADSDHPTFTQAMASPYRAAWQKAMQDEFDSLNQHSVGTLIDPPPGANILGGMWVFSKKRDKHNRVVRFKARWVVFGNHQIKGIDYNDTHASVGMTDSLRILFAIAAHLGMTVCQFDVVTAFLNGDMGETVYARQVTGFTHPTQPQRVWLLNKSLYGTRQAARRWQQHFGKTAAKYNLTPAQSDTAVYIRKDSDGLLILHLHVDDSMVFASSPEVMQQFKSFLESQYDVKWTPSPSLYLGIRIQISEDGRLVGLVQDHYIESTLERFAMVNCKPVKSPLPHRTILSPGSDAEVTDAIGLPYQSLVGSLGWIASTTRPDIAYAVSQLGRFNSAWTTTHWVAAKHVLRYLKGTRKLQISYDGDSLTPKAFSDSDFSQCPLTRWSVSGFVVVLGGGPVSWRSARQSVVALSTNEAEYMAAAECAKHLLWVRDFLFDIMHPVPAAIPFYVDNTSAIDTATGDSINRRSKHIDRRFHFIREQVQSGLLDIKHVPTDEMLADHLTKPLGPTGILHALRLNHMLKSA